MLEKLLKEKNLSIYQCSKLTGIPYTTLSELVRGKTDIAKSSAEIIYKLSKILNVSMEELIRDYVEVRIDFELFKSNVCHFVKSINEIDFIIKTLKEDEIRRYWRKKWYPEAFYILAMVDYLSRLNDIPLCTKYDDIRSKTLNEPIYPRDVLMTMKLDSSTDIKKECLEDAIPEFLRFNIIESEIKNVY